jgi:hypothetical protein
MYRLTCSTIRFFIICKTIHFFLRILKLKRHVHVFLLVLLGNVLIILAQTLRFYVHVIL